MRLSGDIEVGLLCCPPIRTILCSLKPFPFLSLPTLFHSLPNPTSLTSPISIYPPTICSTFGSRAFSTDDSSSCFDSSLWPRLLNLQLLKHNFIRMAKPLASLQPVILAAKEAAKAHHHWCLGRSLGRINPLRCSTTTTRTTTRTTTADPKHSILCSMNHIAFFQPWRRWRDQSSRWALNGSISAWWMLNVRYIDNYQRISRLSIGEITRNSTECVAVGMPSPKHQRKRLERATLVYFISLTHSHA